MRYKIKFQEYLYQELSTYLFSDAPNELGCYLLGEVRDNVICISSVIYPKDENDVYGCVSYCTPSPLFTSRACTLAKERNQSLLFVHSHPLAEHPSTFSDLDIESNDKLFTNLESIMKSPIGSLVFSMKGIHGAIYRKDNYYSIESYTIVGKSLQIIKDASLKQNKVDRELYNRQLLFVDEDKFSQYQELNICIIGCGGTGTPTAITLAKSGVKNITIFDDDRIEVHNLPRIDCATREDIGRYKVDVVKEFVEKVSDTKVSAISESVTNYLSTLSKFDLYIGCIDNHTVRAKLNECAIKYATPYIDTSCSIPLSNNNEIVQAVISTSIVYPLKSCLWCLETINALAINEESLSYEDRESLKNEGYLVGVESAPSIKTLTALASAKATNKVFNLLGVYSPNIAAKEVEDAFGGFIKKIEPKDQECLCKIQSPFSNTKVRGIKLI